MQNFAVGLQLPQGGAKISPGGCAPPPARSGAMVPFEENDPLKDYKYRYLTSECLTFLFIKITNVIVGACESLKYQQLSSQFSEIADRNSYIIITLI